MSPPPTSTHRQTVSDHFDDYGKPPSPTDNMHSAGKSLQKLGVRLSEDTAMAGREEVHAHELRIIAAGMNSQKALAIQFAVYNACSADFREMARIYLYMCIYL